MKKKKKNFLVRFQQIVEYEKNKNWPISMNMSIKSRLENEKKM